MLISGYQPGNAAGTSRTPSSGRSPTPPSTSPRRGRCWPRSTGTLGPG
ncbi:hypothetical protein ACFQ0M_09555 [Kitasatospora aburaviensis]